VTTIIKFIKPCLPYNTGEIAGFPDRDAQIYIKEGYAALYGDGEPKVVSSHGKEDFEIAREQAKLQAEASMRGMPQAARTGR
jgi:hypothetical protein